ncbi:MAG: acyl-ACP desaturase [Dehalococcoidia bacterium]
MSRTTGYYLPESAAPRLEALVDSIVADPGQLLNVKEMYESAESVDVKKVVATLPEGLTEEDLVGMLKLAMLTESATDSYAAVFAEGAKTYDAPWLTRFNEKVWVPDEHTHYTPYKLMLQSLGYSEAELDQEIKDVQGKNYEHCCGKTPVELTTYGVIQEYLTDNWHGLISKMLKPAAPYAAHCANGVKRRETLHTVWYRDMTAVQIEENPEMIGMVADTMLSFKMPGTTLTPQFGSKALHWMNRMDTDFAQVAKDLVRNFSIAAGTLRRSGEMLMEMAVRRGYPIGPFAPTTVKRAMDRLGGMGYGLLGEAILDKVNLPRPNIEGQQDRAMRLHMGVYERIRSKARDFIGSKIDLRVITGETSASQAEAS